LEWKRGAIIDVAPIKHICLVGTNRAPVQEILASPHPEEPRSGVSKDVVTNRAAWLETRASRAPHHEGMMVAMPGKEELRPC
jgi:hypothetical protein